MTKYRGWAYITAEVHIAQSLTRQPVAAVHGMFDREHVRTMLDDLRETRNELRDAEAHIVKAERLIHNLKVSVGWLFIILVTVVFAWKVMRL